MNFMFCCYIYSIYNPQWGFCFMVGMSVIWIELTENLINFDLLKCCGLCSHTRLSSWIGRGRGRRQLCWWRIWRIRKIQKCLKLSFRPSRPLSFLLCLEGLIYHSFLMPIPRVKAITQYLLYRTIDENPLIRTIFLWDECILITERQCTWEVW